MSHHEEPNQDPSGEYFEHKHISLRTYILTFVALMVLMVMTVGAHFINLGPALNAGIAVTIAIAKTALIVMYFMHLSVSSRLVQLFAAAAFLWLLILFGITMGDYLARGWPPAPVESLFSATPAPPGHNLWHL
jgi:cytochrome c oxidase subunit IV